MAVGAALLAAAATADEFDESALAATNAAMAGVWSGIETFAEQAGEHEVTVTIAITSEDGLSHALWSREFLARLEHSGDGECVQRLVGTLAPVGVPRHGRWSEIQAPDADGNWVRTARFEGDQASFGTPAMRQRYVMRDGVLSIIAEREAPDGRDGYVPFWTLRLTRAAR